ncbi:membrane protein [Cupriavidus gilardii CR3]|uniref:DUF308 domain-containing protein n=1 Tax=Cupriavidus gilardii TaxID=82541 RepID=A0A849BBN1_9BURK|nr:hypothetical protein [Cupriavidus gilardii]ALD91700.1 membrane protein [Cupriavidus gilardii CR3]KAB0595417.1 DUF308 domain-containing protein [Cupriavidus gilardii]MCT9016179.1 DUF308 domain-containing protein [Cupriavidus gilardii]MCT9055949.1 DUF308 domain-containing protein [Cupriavidus gilardii]NNH11534.1 DUF308 domain-containing protein [Cupriavidus gilardii]
MTDLVLLLLGVEYLRGRCTAIAIAGAILLFAGIFLFVDAIDGWLQLPLHLFAALFLIEGLATLAIATVGVGGQRVLRSVKGAFMLLVGVLVFAGHHHGNFLLSMIFAMLFLIDGSMQCVASYVVRYPRWRYVFAAGAVEILLAVFFFQPYPTHYAGTLPYAMGLFIGFTGLKLLSLSIRAGTLSENPAAMRNRASAFAPASQHAGVGQVPDDCTPVDAEHALTVHVWTPTGSAKAQTRNYPVIDRYIAAVDINGVVSTGHAALEAPGGIYISLYPAEEIDHSPAQFGSILRATAENNVPGKFQPDYVTESRAWCPSNAKVTIRNYNHASLAAFWAAYRQDTTYNLTHRNCSTSVALALEAALDGVVGRLAGSQAGWYALIRLLLTPELWVAAQIRKRALTMAWTPGMTLDYARALSMLADPRPFGWFRLAGLAVGEIRRMRRGWREEDRSAALRRP